jgi:hypothetical protein
MLCYFVATWWRRIPSLASAGTGGVDALPADATVVWTYFFKNSVDGHTLRERLFQPLFDAMKAKGQPHLRVLYANESGAKIYAAASRVASCRIPGVVFLESYMARRDIILNIGAGIAMIFRAQRALRALAGELQGIEPLLRADLNANLVSGVYLEPMMQYRAYTRLFTRFPSARCIYPFENINWEKMLVLGARKASPEVKLFGHQHAVSLAGLLTMRLAPGEASLSNTLPGHIIATGELAKDALVSISRWPADRVLIGCGLRQKPGVWVTKKTKAKGAPVSVLVTTSTGADGMFLMAFLKQVKFSSPAIKEIRIRCHPLYGPELFIPHVGFPGEGTRCVWDSYPTLFESAQNADVVAYSHSSSGLECIMELGTPMLCVDTDRMNDMDSTPGLRGLKRKVSDPADFEAKVLELAWMEQSQYEDEAREAFAYAKAYVHPVTESGLKAFLN